jgi:hypothetical protein
MSKATFAPYSLRMVNLRNLGRLAVAGEAEKAVIEALRLRDFGSDATYFGFKSPILTVMVPSRRDVKNMVFGLINKWEEEVKERYNLDRRVKLMHRVEINGDRILLNGEPVIGQDAEYFLRYRGVPLPCLEFRFFTTLMGGDECDVILATMGVPSMVGLIQLLAPLVDAQSIFQPLLQQYGIRVAGEAEVVEGE